MTTMTTEDAIKAAASVARDIADGKLSPAQLEHHAVTELRELAGGVVGPDDSIWPLQVEIARGVLAAGGIPADELAEWLAVARQRAGEPLSEPEPEQPDQAEPEPISLPSAALSPESAEPEPDVLAEPEAVAQPAVAVVPSRPADGYDPLAHWPPSRTLRHPL